jgi:HEPN domain-containing protein
MQPEIAAEVRDWVERAADDLREAEHNLTAAPPLVRGALFHSQQTAEKALKALLAAHDHPFPKTHDLEELGRMVIALDSTMAPIVDRAKHLTPYAWRFRYPGAPPPPSESETREALAIARDVYAAILTRLPDEVRP